MALTGNIKGATGVVANYAVSDLKSASIVPNLVFITDSGKEGLFYYDATDTTTVDDNQNVFVKSDNKRYKRKSDVALSRMSFVVSPSFSAIPAQSGANYKLILVLSDEENGNLPTLYLYDGIGLQWLPTSKLY